MPTQGGMKRLERVPHLDAIRASVKKERPVNSGLSGNVFNPHALCCWCSPHDYPYPLALSHHWVLLVTSGVSLEPIALNMKREETCTSHYTLKEPPSGNFLVAFLLVTIGAWHCKSGSLQPGWAASRKGGKPHVNLQFIKHREKGLMLSFLSTSAGLHLCARES